MKYIYVLLVSLAIVSCQKKADQAGVIDDKQVVIDSMKMEMVKQKVVDSMKVEMAKQEAVKTTASKEVIVVNQAAAPAPARRRWSGAAKGAVIGAGVGAITGAVISKKKGTGAIIGGLAGAGVGAGTGAIIDGSKK